MCSTDLALERTRLAYERTLMAWVRTSTALISFGLTLYKFFQYLRQSSPAGAAAERIGPRGFALSMIAFGVAAMFPATLEHLRAIKDLARQIGPGRRMPRSLALVAAWAVC